MDLRTVDDKIAAVIRRAYLDHLVLLYREQQLADSDLLALAQRFGELAMPTQREYQADGVKPRDPRMPYVNVISNVVENGVAIGGLGAGEAQWHSDQSFSEVPCDTTFL